MRKIAANLRLCIVLGMVTFSLHGSDWLIASNSFVAIGDTLSKCFKQIISPYLNAFQGINYQLFLNVGLMLPFS
jgi:hypothetical protein